MRDHQQGSTGFRAPCKEHIDDLLPCCRVKVASRLVCKDQFRAGRNSASNALRSSLKAPPGYKVVAGDLAQTSRDLYDANATASDWEQAAKDLGLTTDDIEACQNP